MNGLNNWLLNMAQEYLVAPFPSGETQRFGELLRVLDRYLQDHDNCPMGDYSDQGVSFQDLRSPQTFHHGTALSLGWLSCVSYLEKAAAQEVLADKGLALHAWVSPPLHPNSPLVSPQGFVCGNDQHLMVTFRGTEFDSLLDWGTNFDLLLDKWLEGGRVHEGFLLSLQRLWPDIEEAIFKHGRGKKIWFTGHSLGGGIAILAAYKFGVTMGTAAVGGVITLGTPRCGDQSFANNYNNILRFKTCLLVNKQDLVPLIPLRSMGFRHVAGSLHLAADGQVTPMTSEQYQGQLNAYRTMLLGVEEWGTFLNRVGHVGMLDHLPREYAKSLRCGM